MRVQSEGRGAGSNPASRYLTVRSVTEGDGWDDTAAELSSELANADFGRFVRRVDVALLLAARPR